MHLQISSFELKAAFCKIFFFVATSAAFSQTNTFNKTYADLFCNPKETVDIGDGFVSAGIFGTDTAMVWKVDSIGSFVWSKKYILENLNVNPSTARPNSRIAANSSGGFTAAWRVPPVMYGKPNWIIIQFDSNGDSLWSLELGNDTLSEVIGDLIELADGNMLVTGSSWSSGDDFFRWSVKINDAGNILWEKTDSLHEGYAATQNAVEFDDGNIYLIGDYATLDGCGDIVEWPFLIKMDTTGTAIWKVSLYDRPNYLNHISTTESGQLITCNPTTDVYLYDSSGASIWDAEFAISGSTTHRTIGAYDINGFIQVGAIAYFLDPIVNEIYAKLALVKLDKTTGNTISTKLFDSPLAVPFDWYPHMESFNPTTDGGFLYSGYVKNKLSSEIRPWLMKLDSAGYLAILDTVVFIPPQAVKTSVEVFPNPVKTDFIVVLPEATGNANSYQFTLVDVSGRNFPLTVTESWKNEDRQLFRFNKPAELRGSYFLGIRNDNSSFAGQVVF